HVDLAGCSRAEQTQLAALVLAHRKRFPLKSFPLDNSDLVRLAILLRLAVIFHRGRIKHNPSTTFLTAKGQQLRLSLPRPWLQQHPLTLADLEAEQRYLSELGYDLEIEEY